MDTHVYDFSEGAELGGRELLGGKGAGLAEMTNARLPGPARLHDHHRRLQRVHGARRTMPDGLDGRGRGAVGARSRRRRASASATPTTRCSSRCAPGAAFSMPGMMDTVLNLGLNDDSVEGLARADRERALRLRLLPPADPDVRQDRRWTSTATSSRRRCSDLRGARGVAHTTPSSTRRRPRGLVERVQGDRTDGTRAIDFPQDPHEQLALRDRGGLRVLERRRARRTTGECEQIPDDLGTAVNVAQMVFGNKGDDSGTGVAFTRNPSTGEHGLYGDFLANAQGEDVVAGIRIAAAARRDGQRASPSRLRASCSRRMRRSSSTTATCRTSSSRSRTAGCSSCRRGRQAHRDGRAAGSPSTWSRRASSTSDEAVAARRARAARPAPPPAVRPEGRLRGRSPRVSTRHPEPRRGQVVFDADTAEARGRAGERVILVRPETTPDDFHGMIEARGHPDRRAAA